MIQSSPNLGNRYYGIYRGIVVKQLPQGRCKVFIPDIYDNSFALSPDSLPTCEPTMPLFGGGTFGDGMFSYPSVNSIVWIMFENGDSNKPILWAITPGGKNIGNNSSSSEQYQKLIQDVDMDSNTTNSNPSHIHAINIGPARLEFDKEGQVKIQVIKDGQYSSITLGTNNDAGVISIEASNQIQITAPVVNLTASQIMQVNGNTVTTTAIESAHIFAGQSIDLNASGGQVVLRTSHGQQDF